MSIATSDHVPVHVIRPPAGWAPLRVREIWEYRELLFFLTWRDIKVRYKQTALGAAWAILQPMLTMVVFTIFFGRLAGVPSDGLPYPLFAFAGLVPWALFAYGLEHSANSVVVNGPMIKKVYFPRIVVPISSVLAGLVDFALAVTVLFGMLALYGVPLTIRVLWLPLLAMLALISSLAVGIWLSALNVRYRDVRYTVPFLVQVWMFSTPLAYPSSLVPEQWRTLYGLNPMVGVVEGFRWALLDTGDAPSTLITASTLAAVLLLVGGLYYFRRHESTFADVV